MAACDTRQRLNLLARRPAFSVFPSSWYLEGAGVSRRLSERSNFVRTRTAPVTGGDDYRASEFGLARPDVWIGRLHSVVKASIQRAY